MQSILVLFSLMFNNALCCSKQRIKIALYKLNGRHMSHDQSINICIWLFVSNLIATDIVMRTHFIQFVLYLCLSSHLSLAAIYFISNTIHFYLIFSLYGEIKYLIATINCKCEGGERYLQREHID